MTGISKFLFISVEFSFIRFLSFKIFISLLRLSDIQNYNFTIYLFLFTIKGLI